MIDKVMSPDRVLLRACKCILSLAAQLYINNKED